jgi:hypothetical protein
MKRVHGERNLDMRGRSAHEGNRELTEQDLAEVSGGDEPPSTAGDGNGRVYWRNVLR